MQNTFITCIFSVGLPIHDISYGLLCYFRENTKSPFSYKDELNVHEISMDYRQFGLQDHLLANQLVSSNSKFKKHQSESYLSYLILL